MGGFSIWHWLVVLVIVVMVFGTKKLRNLGEDLGSAIRGFRKGLQEGDNANQPAAQLKADPAEEAPAPQAHKQDSIQ